MAGPLTLESWPTTSGFGSVGYFPHFLEQMQFGHAGMGVIPSGDGDRFGSYPNDFVVTGDSTGMQVRVYQGRVHILGLFGKIADADASGGRYTLTVSPAHATLNRIDRVIIRVDLATGVMTLRMLDGTPAAAGSEVAPTPTQSDATWDFPLARVAVAAAATTIASGNVTDDRVFAHRSTPTGRLMAGDVAPRGPNPHVDVRAFGAKFDGIMRMAFTTVSGSTDVTVPLGGDHKGFVSARDVGKRVVIVKYTSGWLGVNVESNIFTGTIQSVLSPTSIRLSGTVGASVTSVSPVPPTIASSGKIFWGSDDSAAIQAAINALMAAEYPFGGEIRCPGGIAMVATGLTSRQQSIAFVGAGAWTEPRIQSNGTTLVACTNGMEVLTVQGNNVRFDGVAIDGGGKLAQKGLRLGEAGGVVAYSLFTQVRISGCVINYYIDGNIYDLTFISCQAMYGTHGFYALKAGSDAIQKLLFIDCVGEGNGGNGGHFIGVEKLHVIDGAWQNNGGVGAFMQNCTIPTWDSAHIEGNQVAGLDFQKASTSSATPAAQQVKISDCWFPTNGKGIRFGGVATATLSNNRFQDNAGGHIDSDNTGLTGALNTQIVVDAANLFIGTGTPLLHQDGLRLGVQSYAYAARITSGADQTLADSTQTQLVLDGVQFDPAGMRSGNTVVAPVDGWYDISAGARFSADAAFNGTTEQCHLYINVDGAAIVADTRNGSATNPTDLHQATPYYLTRGQVVSVDVYQFSGAGNVKVLKVGLFSPFLAVALRN